ncbi:uncharacterized protein BDZ99DRAFT_465938 [Mytilinidion resinicola]|uniref:Uncharacterized protein n=1 Tax=Mytilinidion resinicola TaxID=574789 RepID=A0A6A6YDZ5_9PEZI|nr:uncharacterized protein BDZ99DRAFT_465938 [Mytilinidion resinicola]KAF2806305.1 hypothetical protein BDZ99DRAFT_465938 [Mytilinidion resinicola]
MADDESGSRAPWSGKVVESTSSAILTIQLTAPPGAPLICNGEHKMVIGRVDANRQADQWINNAALAMRFTSASEKQGWLSLRRLLLSDNAKTPATPTPFMTTAQQEAEVAKWKPWLSTQQQQVLIKAFSYTFNHVSFILGDAGSDKADVLAMTITQCMYSGIRVQLLAHGNAPLDEAMMRVKAMTRRQPERAGRA